MQPATGLDADTRPLYVVSPSGSTFNDEHERSARIIVARGLADLIGSEFAGELGDEIDGDVTPYFVPADTLAKAQAKRLGIQGEDDLFGGVVPFSFVGTKAISHPLVSRRAVAPAGWNSDFADSISDCVLPGFTAFSRQDAAEAGRLLLARGPVQVKATSGVAGFGQSKVESEDALAQALDGQDWKRIAEEGLTLELRLERSTTYSVGQVRVAGLRASYCGLQKERSGKRRERAYIGSVLLVVRGGYDALASLDLPEAVRTAVARARVFDSAVEQHYPGFFASRRNYDVIRGFDERGRLNCGVLEQSWRLGGASAAELLALKDFQANPTWTRVKSRTVEVFGELADVPRGALLLYRAVDPDNGPLTRYAISERA